MINVTAFLEYKSRRRLKSSEKEPKPAAPSISRRSAASFPPRFPQAGAGRLALACRALQGPVKCHP